MSRRRGNAMVTDSPSSFPPQQARGQWHGATLGLLQQPSDERAARAGGGGPGAARSPQGQSHHQHQAGALLPCGQVSWVRGRVRGEKSHSAPSEPPVALDISRRSSACAGLVVQPCSFMYSSVHAYPHTYN